MRITRRHTRQAASPYEGVVFGVFSFSASLERRSDKEHAAHARSVEFPNSWSKNSRRFFAEHCFVQDGIPDSLEAIPEEDVPHWLWRRAPDDQTAPKNGGETSLKQVVDRVAGALTYHGWKGGYFDREEDAQAFYDEIRWLLVHRKISPSAPHWQTIGLHWAYGLATGNSDSFIVDYRTGSVRRADSGDLAPHGAVINGTHGALTGEGGIWDLWEREGRILSQGGQCGANISNVVRTGRCRSGAGLPDILKLGEDAADLVAPPSPSGHPIRRITIDATHPDADKTAGQPLDQLALADATSAGFAISLRHLQAIIDAASASQSSRRRNNTALRFAIQAARQAQLPERLIQRALTQVETAQPITAHEILGTRTPAMAETPAAVANTVTVFRLDDDFMNAASNDNPAAVGLIDAVARNGWMGIPTGLHFETPIDSWNPCSNTESIRAAAGDGSFLFLDDTASAPASLNAPAFMDEDGQLDVAGFGHAATLLTIALDISLMISTQPTPRLAKRTWDFRPLSLSLTGIGPVVMAQGVAYDSPEGRALCQALCGLLTGKGYLASQHLAEELGRFPGYAENGDAVGAVLKRHHDHLCDDKTPLINNDLRREVNVVWKQVFEQETGDGLRNAQISLIAPSDDQAPANGSDSSGIGPLSSVIQWQRQAHGIYRKAVHPAVPTALRTLHYPETRIDAVVRHVIGHGTLVGAPGVNHETLKKRGFTEAALRSIETALATAFDITQVFNCATLGEHYCVHMLGFAPEEIQYHSFDMLAALGFSDAGIEAANRYCCGADTLEGAPYLAPEHVPVFDCGEPQGDRGQRQVTSGGFLRMMMAVQPAISGGIGHNLSLPASATLEDCRDVFFTAWRGGLKSLTLRRRNEETSVPAVAAGDRDTDRTLQIVDTARPTIVSASETELHPGEERVNASETNIGIVVRDSGTDALPDAEAPRRATSLPTQSTASVTSSADAVVEQRQV